MGKFYLFRSTTDKLTGHLEHIEESGDAVLGLTFIGEKHWIIVCRKGALPSGQREVAELADKVMLTGSFGGKR